METSTAATGVYRSVGLIANPFAIGESDGANAPGVEYAIRAASLRMLAAIDGSADDPSSRPILVEKSAEVVPQYHIAALAPVLRALSLGDPTPGILPAYVPLDMMRTGRVRAVLNVMAERVAIGDPALAIGLWTQAVLADLDDELPEWSALESAGFDVANARMDLEADPLAYAERVFGEPVDDRSGEKDFETLMRVSTTRQQRLDTDPEDDSTGLPEDATDDPFAEVFVTPLGEVDPAALPEEGTGATVDELLGDYVIAHTKAHLSPVVARGIEAYRAQGTVSMAEEMKVTKAPTKTLEAVLTFAAPLYRSGVVVYDRLDYWDNVPPELRRKIVATLTDLRIVLKGRLVLVMMVVPGESPEIEEVFAAGRHVAWDFKELEKVGQFDAVFDSDIVSGWLASASVEGETPTWATPLYAVIEEGTPLGRACEAISAAIDAAVAAGGTPDPARVASALKPDHSRDN